MTAPEPVDGFVPGFVGEPGHRTFYLQVDHGGTRTWYLLEKGQVADLAVEAGRLLADLGLGGAGGDLVVGDIAEPDAVAFRADGVELAFDEPTGTVELTIVPVADEATAVTYRLSTAQLGAAARVAVTAVLAGRPRCPRCGLAMDPEGHPCPVHNGDLRGYRP